MEHTKTKEQISYNMKQVRSKDTALENTICYALNKCGVTSFVRNEKSIYGKPDIAFPARKIAIFCDGDFWHGYNWEKAKQTIKSNRDFWIEKIEKNMQRDSIVTDTLKADGWTVFRFWGHQIRKDPDSCVMMILNELRQIPSEPYRTIDLCAGIGGIRRGFELTGSFVNVLSAENDKYACKTYQHIFGDNPQNDLTDKEFKKTVVQQKYEVLLAGFPCQTFSRVGLQEGFENKEKGQIFFHIAEIIKNTRPMIFFLENVDRLVTHDHGKTFGRIIHILANDLSYHIIGVKKTEHGDLEYNPKSFVRNSRDFGMPQNRPRTYIIGFDTERFSPEQLAKLPTELPKSSSKQMYGDLNDVLEHEIDVRYYLASGYLDTLVKHRERQEKKGYGFGYRIANDPSIQKPVANTLLATGGSGRERNLIYDPREGVAGLIIKGKKTPLNDKGIRVMTPTEWGKLQGFINYAFVDENGDDCFSFPDGMPDVQKYKQFGNSVTIPVIEEMARFILKCIETMKNYE